MVVEPPRSLVKRRSVFCELRQGIDRLRWRDAIRAARLEERLSAVRWLMDGQILPITQAIADRWGRINSPDQ